MRGKESLWFRRLFCAPDRFDMPFFHAFSCCVFSSFFSMDTRRTLSEMAKLKKNNINIIIPGKFRLLFEYSTGTSKNNEQYIGIYEVPE